MKTIRQALIDEIIYPIPEGYVDNVCIKRAIDPEEEITHEVMTSKPYRGAFADCLVALVQSVGFSESDKSVSSLSDEMRKRLLQRANAIYEDIGEEVLQEAEPTVYINC